MGIFATPSENVKKRVPKSSIPEFEHVHAQATRAFAGHQSARMELMLGFVLSFWVLLQYDRRRINLSRWARGYLYHFSKNSGKRLSPEELSEAEQFLATLGADEP